MKSNYHKDTNSHNDSEFTPRFSFSMKSYVEERKACLYKNPLDSFSPYSFAASISLHIILILIICFGIPHFQKKLPEEKVISFELLQVSSVNNVKAKKVQKDESVKNDDAKKIEKTSEMKPQEESPSPPPPSPAQEEPKPEIQPLIAEKPPEPLPLQEKPKELKPEPKKEEPKKTEPKKPDAKKNEKPKKTLADKELDSLMKNLEKASEGNNPKSNKVNREKTKEESDAFGNFDSDMPESLTSDELIKQQIMKKWNQPISSATEEIVVIIKIFLAINGTVESTKIVSISCPTGKEAICETTKNSAIKAITNASPLVNLNSDDYNSWKEISINFDTRR